jgi:hypothetical protein
MELSPETLDSLLRELAQWLEFEDCEPVEWVVCGGLALTLQNLQSRATRDVDVLGRWNARQLNVEPIDAFPATVKQCIERVAQNHPELAGLGPRWVNLGPGPLARSGLPDGFAKRLVTRRISDRLTLHLLGRDDLLPLKLYAAADEFGARQAVHFDDLQTLKPTFDELDRAVEWIRGLSDFEQVRPELNQAGRDLGDDDLAYYI